MGPGLGYLLPRRVKGRRSRPAVFGPRFAMGKMWARTSQPNDCSAPKASLPAPTGTESGSLLSGLNCSDGPAGEGENPY
jgi:hypothetical protein